MRLIDTDKLCARLSRNATPYFTVPDIENAPTVDAEVVTRCKDCKHLVNASVNSNGFLICSVSDMVVALDDFCSYGEPMEGVDNPPAYLIFSPVAARGRSRSLAQGIFGHTDLVNIKTSV